MTNEVTKNKIAMIEQTTELPLQKSSIKRRVVAFFIDHFVLTFLIVAIAFIALGPDFMNENNAGEIIIKMWFVMLLGFILYCAKDSIGGISPGKWIMGIMVRDETHPNEIPSFKRLFLRNLYIIIWPVEVIVLAINDECKRLGDQSAKTLVLKNPNKPNPLPRTLAIIGVGITFFIFVFVMVSSAMKNSDAYKVATKEIEQNQEIIDETGGIIGYGMLPTGNINMVDGHGQAKLEIKVLGNKKDMNVNVYLMKKPNAEWEIKEMQK